MAYIQKRVGKDGKASYRVQVRLKGYPLQTASFERKTDAQRWGQQTEVAIRERRHFRTSQAQKHTLGELIDRYIEDVLPRKPKTGETQKPQLLWWKEQLGVYTLADLTPELIADCRSRLLKKTTQSGNNLLPATANRYMAVLSHAFTIAIKELGWLSISPREARPPPSPIP